MKTKLFYLVFLLAFSGCSKAEKEQECIDAMSADIHNQLVTKVDKKVCVSGKLTLEPHFVYFKTKYTNDDSLYAGKIYLPIRYAEALRNSLKNEQYYEFSGKIKLKETSSKCEQANCYSYYLVVP
ncbi:MAG: hypothetical protein OQJ89_11170 [Kangiellaceae bacterium]|nr:hypothetical protein [Kangiellaceae bacterium]MCW9017518.1 hypothetical protein [Kangiellaceae bacterium]